VMKIGMSGSEMEGALSGRRLDRKQHQLQANYVFLTWLVTIEI